MLVWSFAALMLLAARWIDPPSTAVHAQRRVQAWKQAHFSFSYERLRYAHAGHRAGRPEIVPTQHGSVRNPTSEQEDNLGGNARGDAESSLDAIPKVLEFLRQSLGEPLPNTDSRPSFSGR
jgi:hypothetical protein